MESTKPLSFLDKIAKLLFMSYVFSIFVFSSNAETNVISKLTLLAFCCVACLMFFSTYKIRLDSYFWYIGAFVAFTFLSILWAIEPSLTITKSITLIQILVMSVFAYSFFYALDDTEFIILSVFISGFCMCLYLLYVDGLNAYINGLLNGTRMGGEFGNVNAIGFYAAITATVGLYYAMFRNKKVCYILSILPIFISLGTGSRKSLLAVLTGAFVLFALKFRNEFTFKNIFKTLIIVVIIIAIFFAILRLEMFSTINERMETLINMFTGEGVIDSSALKRQMMIDGGMEQFYSTPLLGIGIGNSPVITNKILGVRTYLHNNFVEMLSCGGIVGFICYYASFAYLLINLIKMSLAKEECAYLPLAITIILLFTSIATITYYDKVIYIYLVYFFLVVKKWKDKHKDLNNNSKINKF